MNWSTSALQAFMRQTVYRMLPYATVAANGWGRYFTLQDAVDAGHKWIVVRSGTYEIASGPVTIADDDVMVEGAGYSTYFKSTGATGTLSFTGDRCVCKNLSVYNGPGGGGGGNSAFYSGGDDCFIFGVTVRDSDNVGLYVNGSRTLVLACRVETADSHAFYGENSSDLSIWVANHSQGVDSMNGMTLASGANGSVMVANYAQSGYSDLSTGSTVANNEP